MSTAPCTILVVGATGQQGGSVLAELSRQLSTTPEAKVKVLALTRTASSPKAQALPSKYPSLDLSVVEGDARHPEPIFEAHPDIDAVFSYTTPPDEEPQATHLVDAACAHASPEKPTHFVFSSVDRGGEPKSWDTPTDVPHFAQKHNVELHLRTVAEGSDGKLTYTILRPVAFMDNLNPGGTFGMVFASLWSTMSASCKLQLVSVRDIGVFASKALLHRADPRFRNRALGLAGDELTLEEARAVYARVAGGGGAALPQAWTVVGWAVRGLVARNNVGSMFRWFETDGYGVDIDALRAEEPRVQNLEAWLRESSKFEFASGEERDG
ncbi:NAD(P)-binding protein [Daldinia vernicosa]|uniref:NAD(P)-binding protein n=1 Tax=Daldinia vernicosa TaxID=114800 RepID=UPI00200806DC|nr:NAD(P)-binding protein [Daldinia vernicosa]KAI0853932.1 NAD(P)-binding protein [Daldinia vernicosa]